MNKLFYVSNIIYHLYDICKIFMLSKFTIFNFFFFEFMNCDNIKLK